MNAGAVEERFLGGHGLERADGEATEGSTAGLIGRGGCIGVRLGERGDGVRRVCLLVILALCFLGTIAAQESDDGLIEAYYILYNFEEEDGLEPGPFPADHRPVSMGRGQAEVIAEGGPDGSQYVRLLPGVPNGILHVGAPLIPGQKEIVMSLWVRPVASSRDAVKEFFDFDGALLAVVESDEAGVGEVHACHAAKEGEAWWISTGIRLPLEGNGRVSDWVYFQVRINRELGRWNLAVNGEATLAGIGALPPRREDGHILKVFGFENAPVDIDQLYAGSFSLRTIASHRIKVEGDEELRWMFEIQELDRSGSRTVLGRQEGGQRDAEMPEESGLRVPEEYEFRLALDTGTRELEPVEIDVSEDGGESDTESYFIYSPEYDEEGKMVLPKLVIDVDAVLEPGHDLRVFGWVVRLNDPGSPDHDKVLGWGNFERSLRREFELPEQYYAKRFQISVGKLKYRIVGPGESSSPDHEENMKTFVR
ncbi:MAG: hypothetical protein AAF591_01290 [Verrucomicrobiota bacterium]